MESAFVRSLRNTAIALPCVIAALSASAVCAAAAPAPSWSVESSAPTYFVPGRLATYEVLATNVGTGPAEEASVTDDLPPGVEFKSVAFYWSGLASTDLAPFGLCSEPAAQEVACSFKLAQIQPGQSVRMVIDVGVPRPSVEGQVVNHAAVQGGGASASTLEQNTISSHPQFGIGRFSMRTTELEQTPMGGGEARPLLYKPVEFTQAGGHPLGLTTLLEFPSEEEEQKATNEVEHIVVPTRDAKDAVVDLPPGLLGNPQAVPRCPLTEVVSRNERCPADTQVGVAKLVLFGEHESIAPIVNVTPEVGQSAAFGVETSFKVTFFLTAHVVRGAKEEYGLTVVGNEIAISQLLSTELTFWGVPAEARNNPLRGLVCRKPHPSEETRKCEGGNQPSGLPAVPFLTLPADCAAGPQTAVVRADSWEEPGRVGEGGKYEGYVEGQATLPGATGCNALSFNPSIEAQPDTLLADEPVGLGVNLQVPQSEEPGVSATPQLRNAVVTLPEGLSISPGIVDGIQACNESGPEGINFTGPESEEVGLNGELQLAPGHCPNASTIGEAEAETPLLGSPVKGHVYLARPACGAPGQSACTEEDALDGKLYRLYLELGGTGKLADAGVNIKVEGKTEPNPATGQLTTKFLENPQLPFSELRIRLNGGPRAPLDTPFACGRAITTADFTPWSAPGVTPEGALMPGTPDATPSSFFEVGGCANPPGLSPGFSAGTVTPQAGKFSPFTLTFTRKDREQDLAGIQVRPPLGLLGMLSSVPLCAEPQAAQGTCPSPSRIGGTMVASGAGSHPFEIGGNVYLTTGYKGAPFGLSIVTNVVAGPFNLGLVVVRARIDVDPRTSALTVTSDPLPQIIFGVPLRLQRVTVNVDRPGFMFNPTNCGAQKVSATISGAQNAIASVSSPFAVGGCKSLAFKPTFKVSTSGHTNRVRGASLDAKLSFPAGPIGGEANVARVKVSLPKQLPSRLTTLQKACLAATFERDPAACPKGSIVGIAKTSTPVLPVQLTGPVYFVSHGGEAFPSLIVVLQGDGVRVDLTGTTFINKAGITSSTFKTVPDVPVSSFELFLPQGKDSALAANGNLCKPKKPLVMPTTFIAQNGAQIKRSTKIQVTGCATVKKAKAKTKGKNASSARRHTSTTGSGKAGGKRL
jgi:uncharacterized repeat protein (TIGR01451 family)